MPLGTKPLPVGVEVIGIDATRPIPDAVREELRGLFIQHGMLLLRDAGASAEAHTRVAECFGELERHSIKESWVEGNPYLIDISYIPPPPGTQSATQPIYEVGGRRLAGWLPWHTDQCFMPKLSRGGVLRMIAIPPEGGSTGFLDKIALYASLPERLKQRIENLSVIYRFQPQATLHRFGKPEGLKLISTSAAMDSILDRLERDFPPSVHPMVYAQAETGRKVLNVSPAYAVGIEGMENAEGDALLEQVFAHCLESDSAYSHAWRNGDMVAWDNWRILHNAEGTPISQTRLVQRISIKGDYGLGRALNTPHAA
jgi:taurine dioxygenase